MSQSEVTTAVEALHLLNPAVSPTGETAARALSLMLLEPETEAYLSVESADEPRGSEADPFSYLVPRTRIFINLSEARDLRADVLTALAVFVASGSMSLSTGATVLRKIFTSTKMLDDAALDLVVVVAAASAGRRGRSATWEDLAAAYDGDTSGLSDRLRNLVGKKVLAIDPDGWTVSR